MRLSTLKPYYETKLGKLYHGDCLEIMPELPKVDLVLTDPPYGIGFKYDEYIDITQKDGYGEWLWARLKSAEDLLKPCGMMFIYQAMLNIRYFSDWIPRDYRVFAAAKNFVQMRPTAMQYAFDPCVVWWKEGDCKPYSKGTLSRDFHIGNTANTMNRGAGEAKGHPCPRPLDQIQHILDQWSPDNSMCIDPFLGSGTTAIACERLNRRWIGIEISEKYCELAAKRIENETKQLKLF